MNETRKNEEQTREELLKEHELSLEDLEQVSGGDSETVDKTIKPDDVTFNIDNKVAPGKFGKIVVFTK